MPVKGVKIQLYFRMNILINNGKKQAADDEEVSMLEVFSFPKTKEQMAWKEIKDHADKEGITVFQPDDSHSPHAICYNKTVFFKRTRNK